ncbi:hypothetical protein ACHAW6_002079 [Cyclotella cf. meneghiniana]
MPPPTLLLLLAAASSPVLSSPSFFVPPPRRRRLPPPAATVRRPSRDSMTDRYELSNRFERWNFLQKLLENEVPSGDVEDVLLAVLDGYLRNGPEENSGEASPVLEEEGREAMRLWTEEVSSLDRAGEKRGGSRFLHHFVRPPVDYERELFRDSSEEEEEAVTSIDDIPERARSLLSRMEGFLPHPSREEEAHKSAWDVIIELHGRESVRINEEKLQRWGLEGEGFRENMEWKTLCCLGRVLIHYDFLTRGILCGEEEIQQCD